MPNRIVTSTCVITFIVILLIPIPSVHTQPVREYIGLATKSASCAVGVWGIIESVNKYVVQGGITYGLSSSVRLGHAVLDAGFTAYGCYGVPSAWRGIYTYQPPPSFPHSGINPLPRGLVPDVPIPAYPPPRPESPLWPDIAGCVVDGVGGYFLFDDLTPEVGGRLAAPNIDRPTIQGAYDAMLAFGTCVVGL